MAHINDLPLLGNAQVVLGIVFSCVICRPSYLTWTILPSSFFLLVSFGKFRRKSYVGMCPHYRSKIMGVFSGPLNKASSSTTDILWWYMFFLYRGLCPICFLGSWVMVVPYLCSRFHIFDKPVLDKYVY
jgi:hypothetical protein